MANDPTCVCGGWVPHSSRAQKSARFWESLAKFACCCLFLFLLVVVVVLLLLLGAPPGGLRPKKQKAKILSDLACLAKEKDRKPLKMIEYNFSRNKVARLVREKGWV